MMIAKRLVLLSSAHAAIATAVAGYSPISLTTKSAVLKLTSPEDLHRFLGSPSNWPKIVASSHSVKYRGYDGKNPGDPLGVGGRVEEIFGLPPLLPLSVAWECVESIAPQKVGGAGGGRLEFYSRDGVPGIASSCRMAFDIQRADHPGEPRGGSRVSLRMEYEPLSPLALLAVPILMADNALALKLLLPSVLVSVTPSPLNEFRQLMGILYGFAGIAHLCDCLIDSKLLVSAGSQSFYQLPPLGQAFALLWCAAGPLSWSASRIGGRTADLGLIGYGLIEVVGAGFIHFGSGAATDLDPFSNAIIVQGIVALAWLYSSQKKVTESQS